MANGEPQTSLVELPEPCLLAVLLCLADDQVSLCNAARAHSRLHQTAVVALSSVRAAVKNFMQIDNSLLPYLAQHGQHVSSLRVAAAVERGVTLQQLPSSVQLTSLSLDSLDLQLQPGRHYQGVLEPAGLHLNLKQLRLEGCMLLDHGGAEALAAALERLPGLEHLRVTSMHSVSGDFTFPTDALQMLQQLTYLKIDRVDLRSFQHEQEMEWPHLQALTQLRHLELNITSLRYDPRILAANTLSGQSHLTHLALVVPTWCEPDVLANKPQLQHLDLAACWMGANLPANLVRLLMHLSALTQLTYLNIAGGWNDPGPDNPAAAFAALTASSKLRYLNISGTQLPAGAWQHMFPDDRQLPDLQSLCIAGICRVATGLTGPFGYVYGSEYAEPPEGSRLVSCCPALQLLEMSDLTYSPELMVQLTGLTGLHTLYLTVLSEQHAMERICKLTGLRDLDISLSEVWGPDADIDALLLQLTQLRRLTALSWHAVGFRPIVIKVEGPGSEPVWRQLLQINPAAEQAALASLALE